MFEESHLEGDIDKAYIFGKRVSTFCITILPTHPYYLSSKPELKQMRTQSITDLQNVAMTLELIVDIMDEQEIERIEMEKKAQIEKEKAARELMLSRTKKLEESRGKSQRMNGLSQETIQMQAVQKLLLLARKDKPSPSQPIKPKLSKPSNPSNPLAPEMNQSQINDVLNDKSTDTNNNHQNTSEISPTCE